MSETPKTDVELLQCSPRVNPAQFPKTLSNRIAQDYGKNKYIYIYIYIYIYSIKTANQ